MTWNRAAHKTLTLRSKAPRTSWVESVCEWHTRLSTLQQTSCAQALGTQHNSCWASPGLAWSLAFGRAAGRPQAMAAQLLFMGEAELSEDKHPDGHPAWATPREPAAQQARKALRGGAGPVWGLVPLQD